MFQFKERRSVHSQIQSRFKSLIVTSRAEFIFPSLLISSLLLAACAVSPQHVNADETCDFPGQYRGDVTVKWLVDSNGPDREMQLLEDFEFCDHNKRLWKAPKGIKIDGASIPRPAWTAVGSPFVGDYRWSSVIHDHYCVTKERPWREVHRQFYDGMLASGVDKVQAQIFYAAVYRGGPRWEYVAGAAPGADSAISFEAPEFSKEDMEDLRVWVKGDDRSLEEIEQHIDSSLQ